MVKKATGKWIQSLRCQNCNSISELKKLDDRRKEFENTGMIEVDGKKLQCVMMCNKGFFYSSGMLS